MVVEEVETRGSRLAVLADATRALAEAASDVLFETVARQLADATHAVCVFDVMSTDGQWLEPAAIADASRVRELAAVGRLPVDSPEPLVHALRSGEFVTVGQELLDTVVGARLSRLEGGVAIKAALFVPVQLHGKTVGACTLARVGDMASPFDELEVDLARQLGAIAALAIENARLTERVRQEATRTSLRSEIAQEFALMNDNPRGLLDLIARRFGEVVGEACSIRVLRENLDGFEPEAAVYHPDPEVLELYRETLRKTPVVAPRSLAERLLATKKPILMPVVRAEDRRELTPPHLLSLVERLGMRSVIGVPILARGTPIAIALMSRSAPDHPYTEDDLRMIEDLAAHASIAITNSRLLAERRRGADRLRVLSEASKDFAAETGDPAGLLDMVTRRLHELVGDTATIRLVVEDDEQLLDKGSSIYHPDPEIVAATREVISIPQRRGEGVSGRVLATGKPIMVSEVSVDELVAHSAPKFAPYLRKLGIRSMLVVPLRAGGRVIGVVSLTRSTPNHPFTEEDLLFTQDLVTHASLAIKNSRLLASVQNELVERRKAEDALRRTEEQLRQAQKMEAVGRLAGGIAHDFNNLLSVILSYCSFLTDELQPGNRLHEDVTEIQKAGERAADLTRQLLAFSRQQVIEPRILDLGALIGGMGNMLRRIVGEDIVLRVASEPGLGKVKADPGQLEQVIMNLVVNARDAMPDGGTLTIETTNIELDDMYVQDHLGAVPGPQVMIAISDTGSGMDQATQANIFEPFFTTKPMGKGTGLGLSTVFGIVKQSGGSIWVDSAPGRGTTFKIFLPRTDEVHTESVRSGGRSTRRGPETILLVEDDEQVRTVTRGILKRNGYRLFEAGTGAEALRWCETHSEPIDLLLTDMVMPQMNGRELAERLVQLRPELKVLFMSGYTEETILPHHMVVPGIVLLNKPFTPDSLLQKVRSVLDSSESPVIALL